MSKLAKTLVEHMTGVRVQNTIPCMSVDYNSIEVPINMELIQYSLSVKFEKTFTVSRGSRGELGEAIKDMRRAIIEEVFGEFRMGIIEAKHAAYNRDYEKVLDALHKLDREMFSEGI